MARKQRELGRPHGQYLVGWYECQQWDDSDYRKGDTPRMTLADARDRFTKQAGELIRRSDIGA